MCTSLSFGSVLLDGSSDNEGGKAHAAYASPATCHLESSQNLYVSRLSSHHFLETFLYPPNPAPSSKPVKDPARSPLTRRPKFCPPKPSNPQPKEVIPMVRPNNAGDPSYLQVYGLYFLIRRKCCSVVGCWATRETLT